MLYGNPVTEKQFQRVIIDALVASGEYEERGKGKKDKPFDPVSALDEQVLFDFFERTQSGVLEKLRAVYNGGADATIKRVICQKIATDGLIRSLWDGVDFGSGLHLDLVFPRPSATFDAKAASLYDANKLTIMEEVYHKEGERLDLVIFLNGLPLFTVELKCATSASGNYRNAIKQYKEERDCSTRLLSPRIGALAHFAMDTNEVYVCAELEGRSSFFLPFNQGQPEGEDAHHVTKGNPHCEHSINTHYMWDEIWTKKSIFDLLYDFIYIETLRDEKGRKVGERAIFPRFQQMRAVRRVSDNLLDTPVLLNYLIEHSAGSGKTKTIAWLAHKLASLYKPGTDELLFDKVVIATDRKVVDKQLQDAVRDMAKDLQTVRVMDEGKTSKDLAKALGVTGEGKKSSYRIVATTLQKFLHLDPGTLTGSNKRFALIIDEAHGSTSGKNMAAINATLASGEDVDSSLDELHSFVQSGINLHSGQSNIAMIGFTATPTGKTLQQFGQLNSAGQYEAFDLYCMRQAIDEGFIIDVTGNYTTYDMYCQITKAITDDPELESKAAKRKLASLIANSQENIEAKLSEMVTHFTDVVASNLGGKAKAMIVTSSREQAVRYFLAYEKMRQENMTRLGSIQALVAFTGDVTIDRKTWTETGLNGFSDDKTAAEFDTDAYRILIVADKYQTGFDQPKLCAMYVDKNLRGISAVQTLSRLNRIQYDKRTFVLDFRNSYENIQKAFAPYYQTTLLTEPLTLSDLRETHRRLIELEILDADDVEEFNELQAHYAASQRTDQRLWALLDNAARQVEAQSEDDADETRRVIRNFIKQYEFLLQVAPFSDERMHMDYNFCRSLIRQIDAGRHGSVNFKLSDKVTITDFRIEKTGEFTKPSLTAKPELKIAKGTGTGLTETQFEKLSKIIDEWNAKYGTSFDTDISAGSVISLQAALAKNKYVIQSAKANDRASFRFTLIDFMEQALLNGYEQNIDWHKFLLNTPEAQQELLEILIDQIHTQARHLETQDS